MARYLEEDREELIERLTQGKRVHKKQLRRARGFGSLTNLNNIDFQNMTTNDVIEFIENTKDQETV